MNLDTVLIVDDEEINRIILGVSLNEDYNVIEASDGTEALDLLYNKKIAPVAILLDIVMPGMDGYAVLEIIKSRTETMNIPVLFITAHSDEENESRGLNAGAADFISKPFNADIVKTRMSTHVKLYKYNTNLEQLVEEKTRELIRTYEKTLDFIAAVVEYRDLESGEHIRRTSTLTEMLIGQLLSSPDYPEYRAQLEGNAHSIIKATALHDIGKICIPDIILTKPGKLTDEEFKTMETHTTKGGEIISKMMEDLGDSAGYLKYSHEICLYHHERWDGRGYPTKIKDTEIPLSARILSIVDVYDALVNTRVYKPPFTHREAVSIIVEDRGTKFDPNLVDAFVAIADKFAELENITIE